MTSSVDAAAVLSPGGIFLLFCRVDVPTVEEPSCSTRRCLYSRRCFLASYASCAAARERSGLMKTLCATFSSPQYRSDGAARNTAVAASSEARRTSSFRVITDFVLFTVCLSGCSSAVLFWQQTSSASTITVTSSRMVHYVTVQIKVVKS